MISRKLHLPLLTAVSTFVLLSVVQIKVDQPIILLERFFKGSGWIEIIIVSAYSFIIAYFMQDPAKQSFWRIRIWLFFSIIFFLQLILGIMGFDKFLMTGELHLPVPMMIVGGAVFRWEISFMPLLFFSTVILSGPAWCSQLCYFGALDAVMADKRKNRMRKWSLTTPIKITVLVIVVLTAILLRIFRVPVLYTTIIAGSFGVIGIGIILLSGKKGKMLHCINYCPVGTIVNYLRFINPFRFRIDDTCTLCMKCISSCKYDALTPADIRRKKPGITCTLCGDCMPVCKPGSFYYKFPGLRPDASRNLYLGITITLHAVFLALARI